MLQQLMSNFTLISVLAFVNSFMLVYYIIPKISWVIVYLGLNDEPNERSSHKKATPSLAGVSFFVTLIMTVFFIQYFDNQHIGLNLIASSTLIFMVGLKDDLVVSSPRAKLFLETLATLFLFFNSVMEVTSLHGFLGVYEIPLVVTYAGSVLLALTIMNAYNLIDGIDGLAGTVAIVIFSVYGLVFYKLQLYFYFLLCLSFIGMLVAYLFYNFSGKKKVFMGDTGSLLIGFCIAFLTLKFLAVDTSQYNFFSFRAENGLIVVAAILCIPLFDLPRVIGVRLLRNQSPFYPDRNHSHHILIDSGMSHFNASMLLGFINFSMVILFIWLSSMFNSFIMCLVLLLSFALFLLAFNIMRKRIQSLNDD
jgi:UDP-N-acetylmuramyl pentapeptide phosphotransferase/UDP-N-acetylglucosamine-1-phosphate transferase